MRHHILLSVFTITTLLILAPLSLDPLESEPVQIGEEQESGNGTATDPPSTAFILGVVLLLAILVKVEIRLEKNKDY